MRLLSTLFALTLLVLPAHAQAQCGSSDAMLTLPEGQALMTITATERQTVEQDLLVANLSYVAETQDASKVQDEINSAMKKALDAAKSASTVKASTGSYQVYETTDSRTKEKKWRGSQSIVLKSKSAEDLLALVGDLQKLNLTMNGLSYVLDPDTAAATQENMMEAALIKLQSRADRAAKALGKSEAELRDVSAQSENPYQPQPYMARGGMMMEAAAMDMAGPVASSGEETLTLTVSARAILKP